ncbi:tubulin epsilon and delta complex protein 1 isoform X2 [Pungitius pungitius]|uniref:tubulin epsilon and delta complex protein 1 isoform X2 n=1 Tax=Pungitius pungitius TaxID=134920 RepID=UPI002E0D17D8
MQRSKAAVAVEVKQVIRALCTLLAASGLDRIPPPENFRRAKFGGGPEVEDQFWQLLADILLTSGLVSLEAGAQTDGAQNRKLVAVGLWQTGYHADWMCGSWERGEGGGGEEGGRLSSRDLLLALGWLLSTGKLEELLTRRVQKLDKTLLTPSPMNPQLNNMLSSDCGSLRRLHWLIGRLRYQGRTLLSMQEERTRLLHAVLFASIPTSVSSSSSDQRSTTLREECVRVQQLCHLLEAYLNWKRVEKVFWTWMRRGRGDAEDIGERLQCGSNTSCLPLPSLPHAYRARLQTGRPVKHSGHTAEGTRGGAQTLDELPAWEAVQLLLQTEGLLLERRDKQRQANRMQLQEMIGRLDKLVLIPPQTCFNPQSADLLIQK